MFSLGLIMLMITHKDLDEIENRLKDTFITKEEFVEYKSELFNKLDKIVKNTETTRTEDQIIIKRVEKIESHLHLSE